jgi:hypothetical protein
MRKILAILPFLLAGCGTLGFGSKKETVPEAPKVISSADKEGIRNDLCPSIDLRDGAATLRITAGGDGPLDVRYQASFGEIARECFIEGNTFRIKIGVEGRAVSGPKGGAGAITLPIRIALVKGVSTPVWSKLYKVPVQLNATSNGAIFTIIENDVTFPLPSPEELQSMEIYVGFDTKGDGGKQPKKKK